MAGSKSPAAEAAVLACCTLLCLLLVGCGGGSETDTSVCPDCSGEPRYGVVGIDFPSDQESVFAHGRDFYVRGTFAPQVVVPGDVVIKLYRGTTTRDPVVRMIRSRVDGATGVTSPADVETNYGSGKAWAPIDSTKVPDLIKEPGSLRTPGNKVMVTNSFYAGLVLGGATKDFDSDYLSPEGTPLEDLGAGEYLVTVTGLSGDTKNGFASKVIRYGNAPKLFGRFDPPAHLAAMQKYARVNGLRVLTDLLPGYFKVDLSGTGTYEVVKRWRPNNAIEVVNPGAPYGNATDADVSVILYNVKPTSATQELEIGSLLRYELMGTPRVKLLAYDIGEPALTYVGRNLAVNQVVGRLVPLPAQKSLAILRAEVNAPDADDDNTWSDTDPTPKDVNLQVDGGLRVARGEEFELFGVVAPIPTTVQVDPAIPARYTADNFIARIHYAFKAQDGTRVLDETRAIGLKRVFGQDSPRLSVYEFKHDFKVTLPAGTYAVELTGLDSQGQAVPAATAALRLVVSP